MHDDPLYREPIAKRVFDYICMRAKSTIKYFKPEYLHRTFADGLRKAAEIARHDADVHVVLKPQISPPTALQMSAMKYEALANKVNRQSFVTRHIFTVLLSLLLSIMIIVIEPYAVCFFKLYVYGKAVDPATHDAYMRVPPH
jgi:hypothetical protein